MKPMARRLEELPLFPLNTVLFPHAQMMLHVFEDRYRLLVEHCLAHEVPFGIVLIRSGEEVGGPAEPYMIGTFARIIGVHSYDDGRMDVKVQGESRFRIREFSEDKPYLIGYVEHVAEEEMEEGPRAHAIISRMAEVAEDYIEKCFSGLDVRIAKIQLPDDPATLGFVLASMLNIDNLEKQHLLETTDTVERLRALIPLLEAHNASVQTIPNLRRLTGQDVMSEINGN